MTALRFDCYAFARFGRKEFWILLSLVVNKFDVESTSRKQTCDKNLVAGALELTHIAEAFDDLSRSFQRVLQLVNVVGEDLERFHVSCQGCAHRFIPRCSRVAVFFQQFVAFISPPQNDVSFPKRFKHLLVKPVLTKRPQEKIQLEIVE